MLLDQSVIQNHAEDNTFAQGILARTGVWSLRITSPYIHPQRKQSHRPHLHPFIHSFRISKHPQIAM
ncbi:hypothetical protein VTL71DRAFT_2191 [Oculimacula yallundae]|uniref:Ycf15 n=1 Tax=Oculimacula yallundae TaxID=86028 RepID=A0ABR4C868_9HELO